MKDTMTHRQSVRAALMAALLEHRNAEPETMETAIFDILEVEIDIYATRHRCNAAQAISSLLDAAAAGCQSPEIPDTFTDGILVDSIFRALDRPQAGYLQRESELIRRENKILRTRVQLQGKLLNAIDRRTRDIHNSYNITGVAADIIEQISADIEAHDQQMDNEIDAIFDSHAIGNALQHAPA